MLLFLRRHRRAMGALLCAVPHQPGRGGGRLMSGYEKGGRVCPDHGRCEPCCEHIVQIDQPYGPDHIARLRAHVLSRKDGGLYVKSFGLDADDLQRDIEILGPVATGVNGGLYAYEDGVWVPGDRVVRERVRLLLKERFRLAHQSTMIAAFSSRPAQLGGDFETTRYLNLPNGLLEWRTGELHPHRPEVPTTIRLPVEWDPDARCPTVHQWMNDVFDDECVQFALEIMGYCLIYDARLHKAIILYGHGRNGKGAFIRLLTALLGNENCAAASPQALDENRFAAATLYGKLANLCGDVDPKVFTSTETFKKATGGDLLQAEHKYGQPFTFTNRATMVAAFNKLPRTSDTTDGFFSRWHVLPFTRGYFPEGVADPTIETRMHAELPGLLVLAVKALQDLMVRGQFDPPRVVREATEKYRDDADPIRTFLNETYATFNSGQHWSPRTSVYASYVQWMNEAGHRALGRSHFYDALESANGSISVTHSIRQGTRGYTFWIKGAGGAVSGE